MSLFTLSRVSWYLCLPYLKYQVRRRSFESSILRGNFYYSTVSIVSLYQAASGVCALRISQVERHVYCLLFYLSSYCFSSFSPWGESLQCPIIDNPAMCRPIGSCPLFILSHELNDLPYLCWSSSDFLSFYFIRTHIYKVRIIRDGSLTPLCPASFTAKLFRKHQIVWSKTLILWNRWDEFNATFIEALSIPIFHFNAPS